MKSFAFATAALASVAAGVQAFEISFPNNNGGYWVTNYTNTLNWKANSTDAPFFSVQLLNANNSQLNGNFQIGNALTTANGTAQIFIDQIPTGSYTVLFVNSSNYELDRPQVYYTSGSFEVRPNGTEPAQVTANTNADPTNSDTNAPTGSATATLSSASPSSANNGGNSSNSAGSVKVGAAAAYGTLATLALGLGLSLLA